MTFANVVLMVGGTLSGLLAGLFYAFNVSVIPALRSLTAREHITVMQVINVKITNPVFMLSFLGPTVLLPLAALLYRGMAQFPLVVAAALLHIIGVNGVTIVGNVPLNNTLEKVEVASMTEHDAEQARQAYHGRGSSWMRLHNLRTMAAIAATMLVIAACLSGAER